MTFSIQSTNTNNYICTQECLQIKCKDWKQFLVKTLKCLKCGEVCQIDFNTNGIPKGVIPLQCTFIAGAHQKFIGVTLINQLDDTIFIPGAQHIGLVKKLESRETSEAEAHEILHRFWTKEQKVDEVNVSSLNDFITSNDQVQLKRSVKYSTSPKISPETKKDLDQLIKKFYDVFSKDQYDVGASTHPPVEIPTEGPPCISAPCTIPLKFRPWVDNTLNKLLEAGMIQCTMSMWASPVIIVSKKGLQTNQDNPVKPLPLDAKLRMCCDYRKLNAKLPADFWNWQTRQENSKTGYQHTLSTATHIDKMFDMIQGKQYPDHTGLQQSISRTQIVTRCYKEECIHNTPRQVWMESSTFWASTTAIILFQGNARHTQQIDEKLHGWCHRLIIHRERTPRLYWASVWMIQDIQNETKTSKMWISKSQNPVHRTCN